MNKETGKQVWTAPKLEQIAMVDTAAKTTADDERNDIGGVMIMDSRGRAS